VNDSLAALVDIFLPPSEDEEHEVADARHDDALELVESILNR